MSKSRGDKGKSTTPSSNAQQSVPSNVVVPGKFMESDWYQLLADDNSENFVCELIDGIVEKSCDTIFAKSIKDSVRSYAISSCRKHVLHFISWQFLNMDAGEKDIKNDLSWLEEDEATAASTDSWAQGSVPTTDETVCEDIELEGNVAHVDESNDNMEKDVTEDFAESGVCVEAEFGEILESARAQKDPGDVKYELSCKDDILFEENSDREELNVLYPAKSDPLDEVKRRKIKFKPYTGKLPNFVSPSLTPITDNHASVRSARAMETFLDSSDSISNVHTYNNSGKENYHEDKWNALHIPKLCLSKLPTHRIKTGYAVIESLDENFKNPYQNLAVKSKAVNINSSFNFSNNTLCKIGKHISSVKRASKIYSDDKLMMELPAPLLDSIDVSPGVVVNEAGLMKRGPRANAAMRRPLSLTLKPLGVDTSSKHLLTAKDVVRDTSPTVAPLGNGSMPLPAIKSNVK